MSEFFGEHGEEQDLKLSEEERKLVAKLLSDPTYFPVEFRTWLKNYIEGAGISVSASQIRGSTGTRTGLPAGLLVFAAATGAIPPDTLVCDGSAVSRTIYSALFAEIGTSWGPGDGTATFNVPDLRDRALFGAGSVVGVGATDGQPFGSRGGWRHWHQAIVNDPGHSHAPGGGQVDFWGGDPSGGAGQFGAGSDYKTLNADRTEHVPTGIGVSVGPGGTNQDGPNWAGVIIAITTGKST